MFTYANKPQSPMRVIQDGFRLFKTSFSKVWLWQLLLVGPPLCLTALVLTAQDMAAVAGPANGNVGGADSVVAAIFYFLSLFGICAVYYRIHRIAIQDSYNFTAVMRFAFRKFWLAIIILIVYGLVVYLVGFLLGFLLGLLAHMIAFLLGFVMMLFFPDVTISLDFLPILSLVIVKALVIVAAIYLTFLMNLCRASLIVDNLSLFHAIKQGSLLIWGQGWRTCFVLGLSLAFFALCLSVVSAVPSAILFKSDYAGISLVLVIVCAIVGMLFLYSCVLTQLHDLKLRYAMKHSARVDS